MFNHPGLGFFRDDNDPVLFTSYVTVVTTSIFYWSRSWRRGRLCLGRARQLDKLLDMVHDNEDIDTVQHFSYDQFYVVYVKFVGLDQDRDMRLDHRELMDYGDEGSGTLSARIVTRILEVNLTDPESKTMNLQDFTVFLMAEVDKTTPQSLEYWFQVLDLDQDGILSLRELHTFHLDNVATLISLDLLHHCVRFEDLICQLVDSTSGRESRIFFSLPELRKNPRMPHLLNAFINLFKFICDDEHAEERVKKNIGEWNEFVISQVNEMQAV